MVQRGEFAGGSVSLHLAVPVVIPPATKIGNERGALLERELLDGGLDFLHGAQDENAAAAGGLWQMGVRRRVPVVGKESRGVTVKPSSSLESRRIASSC